ncbi:hypothetical protein FRC07_003666 [Ceratobasidium sp. 392]|nr:hypothetical protein FRC07_003666 [Ceratobasidium sp. 392]
MTDGNTPQRSRGSYGRKSSSSGTSDRGRGNGRTSTNSDSLAISQPRGRGQGRGRGRGRGQEMDPNGVLARRAAQIQTANKITTLLFKEPYRYALPDGTSVVVRDRVKESSRQTAFFVPADLPVSEPLEDGLIGRSAGLSIGAVQEKGVVVPQGEFPKGEVDELEGDKPGDGQEDDDSTPISDPQARTNFTPLGSSTTFKIMERSTVAAAREHGTVPSRKPGDTWHIPRSADSKTGVLNFASAKHPGGGFLSGAKSQEEALCRASTLYASLKSERAESFYAYHHGGSRGARVRERGSGQLGVGEQTGGHAIPSEDYGLEAGVYSDSMLYTPAVIIVRDQQNEWASPVLVNVVTSAAVNAEVVRQRARTEAEEQGTLVDEAALELRIRKLMHSRMYRVLSVFKQEGDSKLILGSFGTGVFQNRVRTIAEIWAELLVVPGAPFRNALEEVEFAILGHKAVTEIREVWARMVDDYATR